VFLCVLRSFSYCFDSLFTFRRTKLVLTRFMRKSSVRKSVHLNVGGPGGLWSNRLFLRK